MADIIVNINFIDSRKKHGLIIETYEGTIPRLKTKQFSGQLRNANLSHVSMANNLSVLELNAVKKIFNKSHALQINKYQYLYTIQNISLLSQLIPYRCLFYKDLKKTMYLVEKIIINSDIMPENELEIAEFKYYSDKTTLYYNYKIQEICLPSHKIIPLFYIEINKSNYPAELFFDYGTEIVKYPAPNDILSSNDTYRDYRLEQEIINKLKQNHWRFIDKTYFEYTGNNITSNLKNLKNCGIKLYTHNKKSIRTSKISNINISYSIDWFEIHCDIAIDKQKIDALKLIDLKKQNNDWIELDDQIVFLPDKFKKIASISHFNTPKIPKKEFFKVLDLADSLKINGISKLIINSDNIIPELPTHITAILRPYQMTGVKWLLSLNKNGFGGCLADDMGLGKTIQIIAYLSNRSFSKTHSLIIVPKTLLENWKREFFKFLPDTKIYVYHGNIRSHKEIYKHQVIITTYGTIINDFSILQAYYFENMIIDEAQYIKNYKSKAYQAIKCISAKTKLLLTGTPIENNIQEYWNLMMIANPTDISFNLISKGLNDTQTISKIKNITKPFLLRRLKTDVLKDLPKKQEHTVFCAFDNAQRELYTIMLNSIRNEINRTADRFEIKSNSIILTGLLYLQEICCHPKLIPYEYNKNKCFKSAKLDMLITILLELYSEKHKIIIFSRFTKMLQIIANTLHKLHIKTFYLDGTTHHRQTVIDDFENNVNGVFLISLKAGGVGINLTSADTAIIYDPWWNPAIEKQAQDRIYRIGQKKNVTIYKLIVSDTIEEKIQLLQNKKRELFDQVINECKTPVKINIDELKALINES